MKTTTERIKKAIRTDSFVGVVLCCVFRTLALVTIQTPHSHWMGDCCVARALFFLLLLSFLLCFFFSFSNFSRTTVECEVHKNHNHTRFPRNSNLFCYLCPYHERLLPVSNRLFPLFHFFFLIYAKHYKCKNPLQIIIKLIKIK